MRLLSTKTPDETFWRRNEVSCYFILTAYSFVLSQPGKCQLCNRSRQFMKFLSRKKLILGLWVYNVIGKLFEVGIKFVVENTHNTVHEYGRRHSDKTAQRIIYRGQNKVTAQLQSTRLVQGMKCLYIYQYPAVLHKERKYLDRL